MMFSSVSLKTKIRALLFLSAFGITGAALVVMLTMVGMKESLDELFKKRTLSVVQLQEIKEVLQSNILSTALELEEGKITSSDAAEIFQTAWNMVEIRWNTYLETRNTQKRSLIVKNVENLFMTYFLQETPDLILLDEKSTVADISGRLALINEKIREHRIDDQLRYQIDVVAIHFGQLIDYHLRKAIHEKDRGDKIYNGSIGLLLLILFVVILVIIAIERYILWNIRELHISLEDKVLTKTLELRELNNSLREKIDLEVKESRKKDEMLYRQARLASMGEMIANIAHQWRQPLNALLVIIQGFHLKSRHGLLTESYIEKQTEEALRIGTQMSETIEDFRNFFRPINQKEPFALQKTIDESVSLIRPLLETHKIKLNIHYKNEVEVVGYKNQFAQVLINLLNNAIESIISNVEFEGCIDIHIQKYTMKHHRYVSVSVIDNGGGIPEEFIERIFEPYFTTKHQAVGTGIGLYMCKRIIEEQFLGRIKARNIRYTSDQNDYTKWALFQIKFPMDTIKDEH